MKVIDLLNKIANGEEVPKKIKWKNREYKYVNEYKDYSYDNAYCFFEDDLLKTRKLLKYLNDEIEIIEEDKKIEKIETYDKDGDIFIDERCFKYVPIDKYCLTANEQVLADKINEIIDKINKEK